MKAGDYSKTMRFIDKCNDIELLKDIIVELIDNSGAEVEHSPMLEEQIKDK